MHMNRSVMFKMSFELLRINIGDEFHTLFKEVCKLNEFYGIHSVFMPRVAGRQVHQSNPHEIYTNNL